MASSVIRTTASNDTANDFYVGSAQAQDYLIRGAADMSILTTNDRVESLP
jgi:hypothetical protein